MTKLFYEPKRINERKGTEPVALVCMRFSCLVISMIVLMVFFAFMVYSVASDGKITRNHRARKALSPDGARKTGRCSDRRFPNRTSSLMPRARVLSPRESH